MSIALVIFGVVTFGCIVVAAPRLLRLGRQIRSTSDEIDRLLTRLNERVLPQAESLLAESEAVRKDGQGARQELDAARAHLQAALDTLGDIAYSVEWSLRPIAETAAAFGTDRRHGRALLLGLKCAWHAWRLRAGGREVTPAPAEQAALPPPESEPDDASEQESDREHE